MTLIANLSDGTFAGYFSLPLTGVPIGDSIELSVPNIAAGDISPFLPSIDFKYVQISWFAEIYLPDILANTPKYKSAIGKYALGNYEIWSTNTITDSGFINYISQRTPNYNCWLNENCTFTFAPLSPTIIGAVSYFFSLGKFANGNMRKGNGISFVALGAGYNSCVLSIYYIAQLVEFISTPAPSYSAEI